MEGVGTMSDEFLDELNSKIKGTTGKVVKRVVMDMTTYLVYPNGNMTIVQSESKKWIKDSKEMWKKKKKPKAEPIEEVEIREKEEY